MKHQLVLVATVDEHKVHTAIVGCEIVRPRVTEKLVNLMCIRRALKPDASVIRIDIQRWIVYLGLHIILVTSRWQVQCIDFSVAICSDLKRRSAQVCSDLEDNFRLSVTYTS